MRLLSSAHRAGVGTGSVNIARNILSAAGLATMTEAAAPQKLHGREFWKSIGSPNVILAPMVDQSEFVCMVLLTSSVLLICLTGMENAHAILHDP